MTEREIASTANRARLLADVPPFRPVAVQLLRLMGDSSQTLARIVGLLRTDAVLTAEILRLVNSPLFRGQWEIKNMLQALSFLGLDRITTFIMTAALRGLVDTRQGTLMRTCWRHNLGTAMICDKLAASSGLLPDQSYIAGLIHDIGRIALLRTFPEYEEGMTSAAVTGADLLAAERTLFDIDHTEAGRWLLSQWGCPIQLQNVAGWHEDPLAAPPSDRNLIRLVSAASRLADFMNLRVFASRTEDTLDSIASSIPAAGGRQLLDHFPEIAEHTLTRINGIELGLY